MLFCRQHNFIFIKSAKVAGTSVEYALSKLCAGPEDIVTPLDGEADIVRFRQDGILPRNYADVQTEQAYREVIEGGNVATAAALRRRLKPNMLFYNHISARDIRARLGKPVWDSAFKFSIARNPYEFVISLLYHHIATLNVPITRWSRARYLLTILRRMRNANFEMLAIDGCLATDYLLHYESIEKDLREIAPRIGGDVSHNLPRFKDAHRPANVSPATEFGYLQRRLIAMAWEKEFRAFGYLR